MKALLQKRDTNRRDKGIFYHKAVFVHMSTILLTGFPLVGCCEGLFPDFLALVVEQLEKWHPILPKYPRSSRSIPSDLLDMKTVTGRTFLLLSNQPCRFQPNTWLAIHIQPQALAILDSCKDSVNN
ncbi:hypothetical protein D5086_026255 [Populus alba]|uniref:Uncharacterized protein n=1 Tax=Populus alba TaxID=43335 RepID=A0ACC4B1G1_POPAL